MRQEKRESDNHLFFLLQNVSDDPVQHYRDRANILIRHIIQANNRILLRNVEQLGRAGDCNWDRKGWRRVSTPCLY